MHCSLVQEVYITFGPVQSSPGVTEGRGGRGFVSTNCVTFVPLHMWE